MGKKLLWPMNFLLQIWQIYYKFVTLNSSRVRLYLEKSNLIFPIIKIQIFPTGFFQR